MAPRKPPRPRPRRTRQTADEEVTGEDADDVVKISQQESNEQPEGVPQEEQEVWDSIREEQYEVIEQLPLTLHRMFALLRELDEKYTSQIAELQQTIRHYASLRQTIDKLNASSAPAQSKSSLAVDNRLNGEQGRRMNVDPNADEAKTEPHLLDVDAIFDLPAHGESQKLLSRISWLNSESVRTSEEKFALATTAYDLVDRHVRSLDLAIKAEEASFALGLRPGTQPNASLMQKGAGGSSGHAKKFSGDEGIQSATSGGRPRSGNKPRRPRPAAAENEPPVQPPPQSPNVDANGVALAQQLPNMAIDPNEPRYCYCNQVSFGEMIACDNDDCEREWFHYGCVGITETPKRRWFCQDCEIALVQPRKRKYT